MRGKRFVGVAGGASGGCGAAGGGFAGTVVLKEEGVVWESDGGGEVGRKGGGCEASVGFWSSWSDCWK